MNYKERWKERKIRQKIIKILSIFWFKSLILSIPWKIVLLSSITLFVSLFLPWVIYAEKKITWNSFEAISWNIWYPLIIIVLILIFNIFSSFNKDKIKLHSNLTFKNHFLIILIWFFIITSSIITINFINWLDTFVDNVTYWKWVIITLTAWFFITLWWILMKKEHEKSNIWVFYSNIESSYIKTEEKNNTKLPF